MNRRDFSRGVAGMAGLGLVRASHAQKQQAFAPLPFYDTVPKLIPIRAHEDRIFRVTVCLRPFRAQGPRLDVEKVGDKVVVHNYGHGGSGWSLSWGSSSIAVKKAMAAADGNRNVAVIGCGAMGLTSALLLQRAGARVTIYAKERPPDVRSSRATGSWTPDSRVALTASAPASFGALWEEMARASYATYQSYLGLPGNPVEWTDRYFLSDTPAAGLLAKRHEADPIGFAQYQSRISDITPKGLDLPAGSHPFPTKYARRNSSMTFNVAAYSKQLIAEFLVEGGKLETAEFHSPADFRKLQEKVIVHATGYGARALWKDASIVPVRGQIAWLIPQTGVDYGLTFGNFNVLGRRHGIVVQLNEQGDETGWKDDNETPDQGEADRAVQALAALYGAMGKAGRPE